jgi:hypothetical protein
MRAVDAEVTTGGGAVKAKVVCAGFLLLLLAGEAVGASPNEIIPACKSVSRRPTTPRKHKSRDFA